VIVFAALTQVGAAEQRRRIEELQRSTNVLLAEFRDALARGPEATRQAIAEIVRGLSDEISRQIIQHDQRTREIVRQETIERQTTVVVIVTMMPSPRPTATVTCNPTPVVGNCRRS
jgi:hypothetical protein